MGRGLSEQQRRVLAVAYGNYQRREERQREAQEDAAFVGKLAAVFAATRGQQAPAPRPTRTPPDLFHADALLALYGWRGSQMNRTWRERRLRIPSDTVNVYHAWRKRDDEKVATIGRDEYNVAHASTARTIARLVARGLLEQREPRRYFLTDAGRALCAELDAASGTSDGEGEPLCPCAGART